MPIEYTIAYCALIKGLFYDLETVEKYLRLTNSINDIKQTKANIRKMVGIAKSIKTIFKIYVLN